MREGTTADFSAKTVSGLSDLQKSMTTEMLLDYLGIIIDANAAENLQLSLNLKITDTKETYLLQRYAGVLLYQKGAWDDQADATLTMPKLGLLTIINQDVKAQKQLIKIQGKKDCLDQLTQYTATFNPFFPIIEP